MVLELKREREYQKLVFKIIIFFLTNSSLLRKKNKI